MDTYLNKPLLGLLVSRTKLYLSWTLVAHMQNYMQDKLDTILEGSLKVIIEK